MPLANRATIGNMSPEFGSTAAIFPIDDVTLDYLRLTGRREEQVALVEAYAKEQGLWHDPARPAEPRLQRVPRARPVDGRPVDRRPEAPAGPHRARPTRRSQFAQGPADLRRRRRTTWSTLAIAESLPGHPTRAASCARRTTNSVHEHHHHGHAPKTASQPDAGHRRRGRDVRRSTTAPSRSPRSRRCTNTSNPSVMLAAGAARQERRREGPEGASRGSRPRWRPAPRSSPTTTRRPA